MDILQRYLVLIRINKKDWFLLFILFVPFALFSQSIQRHVFSVAGNSNSTSGYTLQSNIGELMVETYLTSSNMISQGFVQNDPLGVSVNNNEIQTLDFKIFPNPVFSVLNVDITILSTSDVLIEVFDVLGKKQQTDIKCNRQNNRSVYELDFENTTPGLYFIQIRSSANQLNQTFKITKIGY